MFINDVTGFHMVMPNGYTFSVQCSPAHKCSLYDMTNTAVDTLSVFQPHESQTAEILVTRPDGNVDTELSGDYGDALGHQTTGDLMRILRTIETYDTVDSVQVA